MHHHHDDQNNLFGSADPTIMAYLWHKSRSSMTPEQRRAENRIVYLYTGFGVLIGILCLIVGLVAIR